MSVQGKTSGDKTGLAIQARGRDGTKDMGGGPFGGKRSNGRGRVETKDMAAALLIGNGSNGVLEGVAERGKAFLTGFIVSSRSEVLAPLKQSLKAIGWGFEVSSYKDTDWETEWKKHLKPI